jgi:hypothetical protein
MFTRYNAHRYILIVLLKGWIIFVFCSLYLGNEIKDSIAIIQCIITITIDIEPLISALTLFILVHTTFVSSRDVLYTFGGVRNPNRAVLKKKKKKPPVIQGIKPPARINAPNNSTLIPARVKDALHDKTYIYGRARS